MAHSVRNGATRRYGAHGPRLHIHAVYVRAAQCGDGIAPGTLAAHSSLYVGRIANLVAAAVASQDFAFVDRLMAPIDAARASVATPSLSPELIEACQASDLAEDMAEVRCLASMTLPKKKDWLAKVRAERSKLLLLELALAADIEAEGAK